MRLRFAFIFQLLVIVLAIGCGPGDGEPAKPELHVAVAANFFDCASDLAREFEEAEHCVVVLTSGSTGRLAKQIEEGAPFAVFLAADRLRPLALATKGLADPESRFTYARGQLVLAVPEGRPAPSDLDPGQFGAAARIAIAQPALAPYGQAAIEVIGPLEVKAELVYGDNVAQVAHYVGAKVVDFGFLPLSLARSRGFPHLPIEVTRYHSIDQQAVLVDRDSELGRRFLQFLKGDRAHRLITESGYLPG